MSFGSACVLGPVTRCIKWSRWSPRWFEIRRSNPKPKHAIVDCSQTVNFMLPPEKYRRVIPPVVKLFRSFLVVLSLCELLELTVTQTDWKRNIHSYLFRLNRKVKSPVLLKRFLHKFNSWREALRNLRSGSPLTWANDTAAHYAAIHCPHQQTCNWTHGLQPADIPPPQSATLCLHHVACKLLLICHHAYGITQ